MGLIITSGSRLAHDFPDQPALVVGNSGLGVQFIDGGQGTCPTEAFDTTTGLLFAAVGRGVLSEFAQATVTDNASNTLEMHGTSHAYTGTWPNSGTACFYKFGATGRSGCIVSDSKPDNNDEVTILALNIIGATQIEDASWVYDTSGPTNTGTSIDVTVPSVLISVWAGDHEDGELDPDISEGWTIHEHTSSLASNHVQMAIATRSVDAGTHGVVWTPSTSQGGQVYLFGVN